MRKVLLVDDEEFIRTGIRTILQRSETEFIDIYECSCGEEALKLVKSIRFDLVVLDIRMPNMDGITFMQKVQELPDKPYFIVISGYSEFEYARSSVKFGAREYLLKPVSSNELINALKKIEQEMIKVEKLKKTAQKANNVMNKFIETQLNNIFLDDNPCKERLKNFDEMVDVGIFNKEFRVCVLKCSSPKELTIDPAYVKVLVEEVALRGGCECLCLQDIADNTVAVIDATANVEEILSNVQAGVGNNYIVGISSVLLGIESIKSAYNEACEALKYVIFYYDKKMFYYQHISNLKKNFEVPMGEIQKIPEILGTRSFSEVEKLLNSIFNIDIISQYSVDYTEALVESVHRYVIGRVKERIPNKCRELVNAYGEFEDVYTFKNLQEYYNHLKKFLIEINDYLIELKEEKNEVDEIDKAIAYIKENYNKDINLTVVSNQISLTYTYFSYLFKERTGQTFSEFLRNYRIERAKEMLKNGNYMVSEVAKKVGYDNPKRFRKIFRKVMGITPSEYREKII